MMDVYGDPDVMRSIPGGPLPDLEAVRAVMDEQTRRQAERGYAYYAVELVSDGSVVGDAGFGLFIAVADVDNLASHRVAERIGMRPDGRIDVHGRPHAVFVATDDQGSAGRGVGRLP
jgi:RimJ/RimL family protein N-acetyltransferase